MLFTIISFIIFLPSLTSSSETWIKVGSWFSFGQFPVADIDTTLFTHLTFGFALINSSTYELRIASDNEPSMSTFTQVVQQKNPSIVTLLSILVQSAVGDTNLSTFYSMATQPSHRTSFIESSIYRARHFGFHGLDLCCVTPDTSTTKMEALGILFDEWRTAINRESKNSTQPPLILTMAGHYLPSKNTTSYPMESIRRNIDWVHIVSYFYHLPTMENFTGAHSALYDPSSNVCTDYGIKEWISRGLPAKKMVLGLLYQGYAWTLLDPSANEIGSPATGPAITSDGLIFYKSIKSSMGCDGEKVRYNSTYVTNYCINGSVWISYDDAEAIRTKVSYAREKGLLGYKAWHVGNDDNWVLSKAAAATWFPHFVVLGILRDDMGADLLLSNSSCCRAYKQNGLNTNSLNVRFTFTLSSFHLPLPHFRTFVFSSWDPALILGGRRPPSYHEVSLDERKLGLSNEVIARTGPFKRGHEMEVQVHLPSIP
ncbi:hypothetical protein RHSIM_Rhsim01G0039700 [Rhododendron simsii]|uniref:GH18 domain-containing protein n=1 Tax=Rhododendron simsii TaxID=118357 RepID=A0A834HTS2_RHOSS|nr:hypothetical protein RHSIM_Rhsim01G0039700 [Rhododendron simsii]